MLNIDELIKTALKSKSKTELRAYRNLKAEFLKAETAKNAKPVDEVRQIQIIKKYCETLEKSILDFSEARREDLVADYMGELEVLKKLLPKPVNERQIYSELLEWCRMNHLIQRFQTAIGYEEYCLIPKKEMGNAIKYLKSKFPQADGKMISDIIKRYII